MKEAINATIQRILRTDRGITDLQFTGPVRDSNADTLGLVFTPSDDRHQCPNHHRRIRLVEQPRDIMPGIVVTHVSHKYDNAALFGARDGG